jgi:hypothetical protein
MQVRRVVVSVFGWLRCMLVRMLANDQWIVGVSMMPVVMIVRVCVPHRAVDVGMGVALRQVKPEPNEHGHQSGCG